MRRAVTFPMDWRRRIGGLILPAAMKPKILTGIAAHQVFESRGHALRHCRDGIGTPGVVFRMNQIRAGERVLEKVAGLPHADDVHQGVRAKSEQGHRFVRRCRAPEKIDEESVRTGILIDDRADHAAPAQDGEHFTRIAILCERRRA